MDISDFVSAKMDEHQLALAEKISNKYLELAGLIMTELGPTAHRTAAIRLLHQSKMTIIHDISHR